MHGSPLEFKQLTPDWQVPLAEFFEEISRCGDEDYFHPHPMTPAQANTLAKHSGKDLYLIATKDRRILAYGMLRGWDEGYEVPSLGIAVSPAARGIGLGKAFMGYLHAVARQRGASKVRLKVYISNQVAVALYTLLGYHFTREEGGQLIGTLELK